MLLFTQQKFVVLSNRKCASTSLVHTLGDHAGGVIDRDHRIRHTNYREYQELVLPFLRAKIGSEVDDYDVYCVVREPTDWYHSWYRFRTREQISPENAPGHWEYAGHFSWREYLEASIAKKPEKCLMRQRQFEFACGQDGSTDGLTLIRYDDMAAFFDLLCERVGVEAEMLNWNVSPVSDTGPTNDDRAYCREHVPDDYRLYESIRPLV